MDRQISFFCFPEKLDSWRKLLPFALLLSVTFALYATTLYFRFVWDDEFYVLQNFRAQGLSYRHLRAVWTSTYLGHYAPIQHTFLAILHHFSGMEPFGYHLGQLLVHAACVCVLFFLLKKIESPRVALLSCLLFVVHPANIETVAWISETKSTLAFFFFLLSFWAFLRWRENERGRSLALCAAFLILSVLAKINTVVAPAIFLLYDYWQGFSFRWKRLAGLAFLFLISAVLVGVHLKSFHGSETVLESTYYGGLGVHIMNLPFLLLFYIRMVIVPYPLSAWHMFRIYDRFTWVVSAAWLGLLGTLWLLYRSNRRIQFWGLWFLVFLAPVLQIIPFPIWVAERYLYIPAIGMFVLGSRAFFGIWDRLAGGWKRMAWELAIALLLIAYSWEIHAHLPIWRNDQVLWEATAATCPTSAYCHSNFGLALLQVGQTERGVKELIRSVEIRPAPRYLIPLGDAYTLSLADYRQALIAYNMALQEGGRSMGAEFYAKLARAFIKSGNLEQAQRAVDAGAQVDPSDPTLLVINGFLQWKLGKFPLALNSLRKSLAVTGQTSNPSGFFYHYWGDPAEVGRLISDLRPNNSQALPKK